MTHCQSGPVSPTPELLFILFPFAALTPPLTFPAFPQSTGSPEGLVTPILKKGTRRLSSEPTPFIHYFDY